VYNNADFTKSAKTCKAKQHKAPQDFVKTAFNNLQWKSDTGFTGFLWWFMGLSSIVEIQKEYFDTADSPLTWAHLTSSGPPEGPNNGGDKWCATENTKRPKFFSRAIYWGGVVYFPGMDTPNKDFKDKGFLPI